MPNEPGRQLLHYRLIDKIGAGGMGEVYRAEDTRLGRQVAIKVLPEEFFGNPHAQERFQREARAASALNHPHICTIYDVGEQDQRPFMVMELLQGQTLKERIEAGPLDTAEIVKLGAQIADALATAHANGILHRDIKPANIFVTERGDAKILDFGLAKLAPGDARGEPETKTKTLARDLTGAGTTVGTIAYMSPEQVLGKPLDARSDIFSLGIVLYEMATGTVPFEGDTWGSIFDQIIHQAPPPPLALNPELPHELERIIHGCLEKDAARRPASADTLRDGLETIRHGGSQGVGQRFVRLAKRPSFWIAAVVVITAILALAFTFVKQERQVRRARTDLLPEIRRLSKDVLWNAVEAYRLAEQAEPYLADDPEFQELLSSIAVETSIVTDPPGATVHVKPYAQPDAPWELVGVTPIDRYRVPFAFLRWKLEKAGFETRIDVRLPGKIDGESGEYLPRTIEWKLDESGSVPSGMILVTGAGDLPDFRIDRHEVTNRQFKGFVDAGGYRTPEYWKHAFVADGVELSREEALRRLVDSTGRPGPGTWEAGSYPEAQDEFPVTGVSWYEAAAYAEFAGKSLPTLSHWWMATGSNQDHSMILPRLMMPLSNFNSKEPVNVGSSGAMTVHGVFDLAGNVREWCHNASQQGRCLRGGAWNDETYMYQAITQAPAFDRSEKNGFRCVRYLDREEILDEAFDPLTADAERNLVDEQPVSDAIFEVLRGHYSYDAAELDAVVEERVVNDDWVREQVSFNAAYGDERVPAQLFLPTSSAPPYQVVVYFAGDGASHAGPLDDLESRGEFKRHLSFLIETGRAVLYPAYQGTHGRKEATPDVRDGETHAYASYRIQQAQDFLRSLDYLESRDDIDSGKIAFYGFSRGGVAANIVLALDDRFTAAISQVGGMANYPRRPEIDHVNFTPRVTTPILMLNGRYDLNVPYLSRAKPMFDLIGTPEEHKVLKLYETDHFIPRKELIKETLTWLDLYLGSVEVR